MINQAVIDKIDRGQQQLELRTRALESVPTDTLTANLQNSWATGDDGAAGIVSSMVGKRTLVNFVGSIMSDDAATAFTVPEGSRPGSNKYFICVNTGGSEAAVYWRVVVNSDGTVVPTKSGATESSCQLSNVMYFVNE